MKTIMDFMKENKMVRGSKNNPPTPPKNKQWSEFQKNEREQWQAHCKQWDLDHPPKNKKYGGWRVDN